MFQWLRNAKLQGPPPDSADAGVERVARLAWWVPLVGSVLVFLLGVGLSLSNLDIRGEVQAWGLAGLAGLAAVGTVLSLLALRRGSATGPDVRRRALAGLALSLVLAGGVVANAVLILRLERRPPVVLLRPLVEPEPRVEPIPVWIDTDAACGQGRMDDVDDCWALAAALRSPELAIRGVSTTFGNVEGAATLEVTRDVLRRFGGGHPPPVFRGADAPVESLGENPPPAKAGGEESRDVRRSSLDVDPAAARRVTWNLFGEESADFPARLPGALTVKGGAGEFLAILSAGYLEPCSAPGITV